MPKSIINNKLYVKWEKEDRDWTDFQLVTPELIANWKRNSRIAIASAIKGEINPILANNNRINSVL